MDLTYRIATGLGRGLVRGLDLRTHVHGAQHLPASGPVVLAATHGSYLDFVVLQKAARTRGRRIRFMIRYDVWRPGLGWALDAMQHIPVDRAAPAGALVQGQRLLEQGRCVGLFPEAGISYSFTVRPLMPGAVALARASGAPLIPVALWGAHRVATVGEPEPPVDWTRGRRVDISFGEPIRIAADADVRAATVDLGHRLTALLEELQRHPEHRPAPGEHAPWYPAHLGGDAPTRESAFDRLDLLPKSAVRPTWGPIQPADAGDSPSDAADDPADS